MLYSLIERKLNWTTTFLKNKSFNLSFLHNEENMKSENFRHFMGYLWVKDEGGIITIGINEDGLEDFEEILTIDLPSEGEEIEAEVVCGTIETDDGPIDIYSPVSGKVIEVNSSIIEDPTVIQEDPYEEGWLIKIESSENEDDDDDDDDDDNEEEPDDDGEDYED